VSAQPGDIRPVIRQMTHDDLDSVLVIESAAYGFPWNRKIFTDCLMAGYLTSVLESDEGLIGYSILSTAAAEAHILNLCVHPEWQRQGLGQQLLDHLLDYTQALGVERIFLEVRPSNDAAILLYENAGFVRLGLRKSYYRGADGREDALVLVLDMPATAATE
jgi:ribosomal-protein-alanine N-acetyltransferase